MDKVQLNGLHVLKPSLYESNKTPAKAHQQFSKALSEAINNVNKTQIESDVVTTKFIKGEIDNLHDVMIAAQKASVTRTAAISVRDKVVEAYKEIMRMQV